MTEQYVLEYVWIDGFGELRSKTKIVDNKDQYDKPPLWTYDGSSTGQATGTHSDVILQPVNRFIDPFSNGEYCGSLIFCETLTSDGRPHVSNHRSACVETYYKCHSEEPLFGIEQEYLLKEINGLLPFGWATLQDPGCGPQGPYYCSVGADRSFGRHIAVDHMKKCLKAGIKIGGVNAEVMPSQWEFQIGPLPPLDVSDQLWMSRYILHRVCELNKCIVTFHPKPLVKWNGSGGHTNFSTKGMRSPGGMHEIVAACELLAGKHKEHMAVYGQDNDQRLTGHHETANINDFSYGVANRSVSIRIPLMVEREGCGYLEDRRPAANLDPYWVTNIMMETILLAI